MIGADGVPAPATAGGGFRNENNTAALRQTQTADTSENEKHHLFRGRRAKGGGEKTGRVGYDGEEDTITTMGKIYNMICAFFITLRGASLIIYIDRVCLSLFLSSLHHRIIEEMTVSNLKRKKLKACCLIFLKNISFISNS